MAKQKKNFEERTQNATDIEAGVAAFQALQSASEERKQSLSKLVEPYRDGIREALERGVSKRVVLNTLNRLIGHSLTAKKLDELLGGGTMRGKSKGGASSLIAATAAQTVSNKEGA
jgi:hypothetical protein